MTRRYPIEPLLALLRERGLRTQTDAGDLIGLSGSSMKAALERGLVVKAADRSAQRAGYHPAEVWPSWFDDAVEDTGKPCAYCGERFLGRQRNQRFCPGTRCGARWHARDYQRRVRKTEAGRAANYARTKAWREELSEAGKRAQLAKQRERDRKRDYSNRRRSHEAA